jgi:copper chaperone NosL
MTFPRKHTLSLAFLAAMSAMLATGCSNNDSQQRSYEPIEITAGTSCALDGMLLSDYPGPKAQIHYADQQTPDFFCDTLEVLNTLLVGEQVRPIRAVYVQDMGKADWEEPKGHWVDAKTAFYVFGSHVHGSMGPTAASFATKEDAEAFVSENGGKLIPFAEITPDLVDLRGGALHDSHM